MAEVRRLPVLVGVLLVLLVGIVGFRAQRTIDADALHARAEAALRGGDAASAVTGFRRALERDPHHADSWVALAGALAASGDTLGALAAQESVVVRAVRERWPLDAQIEARRSLGLQRYRTSDWSGAIRDLGVIDAQGAGSLETDLVLQVARLLEGSPADVLADLPRLRARYGDTEPLWKLEMSARAAAGTRLPARRTLEAFVSLRAAPGVTELEPAAGVDPMARALLPPALLDAGRAQEAAALAAALRGGPFAAWGELQSARIALAAGDLQSASAHAAALVADDGVPRESAYLMQAEVLRRQGLLEPARAAAERAVEANPASTRGHAALAAMPEHK